MHLSKEEGAQLQIYMGCTVKWKRSYCHCCIHICQESATRTLFLGTKAFSIKNKWMHFITETWSCCLILFDCFFFSLWCPLAYSAWTFSNLLNAHGDSGYQGVIASRNSTLVLSVLTSIFVLNIKFEFVHQCPKHPVALHRLGFVLGWVMWLLNQAAVSRNYADPTVLWAAVNSAWLLSSHAASAECVTI